MYLRKSNSTTTCFMLNTMFDANRNELIFSACVALLSHIRTGIEKGLVKSGPDMFNELMYPLESTKAKRYKKSTKDPDVEVVYSFVTKIVDRIDLDESIIVISLAFVERVMVFKKLDLLPCNWRRIVMTAFLIGAKTFYDEVVWNSDFKNSFPNYDLTSLNLMEISLLEMIDYNVIVKPALFAKYYFELRSISEEQNYSSTKKNHNLTQLEGWETSRKKSSAIAESFNSSDRAISVSPALNILLQKPQPVSRNATFHGKKTEFQ
eukprot:c20254_g1_i1.p1 GENE.c20254_g1_i1~~c20254_g1_i1.p1  ORF type:complete len:264 (+),score=67.16 c20254_g1_i1:136-927(+)